MITKYGFNFGEKIVEADKKRLVNQLWKLIPMRENDEDWQKQLSSVLIELAGLNEIFIEKLGYLILLSKLEGLNENVEFTDYRRTVFETINLLDELSHE